MDDSGPVLLFDGKCGLCVRSVRLLLKSDRKRRLLFAPLQGGVAQEFLRERGWPTEDFESVIFVSDWARRLVVAPLVRTDALCAALDMTGGRLALLGWLRFCPRSWRDAVYRWVARWRRQFFGRGDGDELLREFGAKRFVLSAVAVSGGCGGAAAAKSPGRWTSGRPAIPCDP
jgi:predicted DCC family thiol-disulfide oxidoreductase YuxK